MLKAKIKGVLSRSYCCYGNLLHHKINGNLLPDDWAVCWYHDVGVNKYRVVINWPIKQSLEKYWKLFSATLKEKRVRYVWVSTRETDLVDCHDRHTGQNKIIYYYVYFQSLVLFVEQTQIVKIRGRRIPLNLAWAKMLLPNNLSRAIV